MDGKHGKSRFHLLVFILLTKNTRLLVLSQGKRQMNWSYDTLMVGKKLKRALNP
jgi:hypothetical protein